MLLYRNISVVIVFALLCATCYCLTDEQIAKVLNLHNQFRAHVGEHFPQTPPATPLPPLQYNYDLQTMAENWAATCPGAGGANPHNPDRSFNKSKAGENIHFNTGYSDTITTGITNWYNEYPDYVFGNGYQSGTGHFTQVVWAKTLYVGCAWVTNCKSINGWQNTFICDYFPPGNF